MRNQKQNPFCAWFCARMWVWPTVVAFRYIVQTSSSPPTFLLFCTRAANLTPPRLREIANAMRQRFELQGVPINVVPKEG